MYNLKIKTTNEILEGNFSKFLKYLNPMHGVRGKKISYYNLKYAIEEIYSIRYIRDTNNFKNKNKKNDKDEKDSFPVFCVNFLVNKFVKKNIIDQVNFR